HNLISDLKTDRLFDTLEGFHVTPRYLHAFDRAVEAKEINEGSSEIRYCLQFVNTRRKWASVLEDAKEQKRLCLRPIHGDPKFDNIMFDEAGLAIGMIDLDTVKPGLVQYDIGDCLRSCCNSAGEETVDLDAVHFRTDVCRAVLQGYIPVASSFLDKSDYEFIYDSARLIAFELGLRFLTDHLAGNKYFKVKKKDDNLLRALIQFKLTESIESRESDIRSIIEDLKT
ncbi:MAG TPA: aminoglycoside phosphotransferase family protein, partial [Nitrospirae bacterium]|nr:aminoglycoside phosphotransferase family protein [Nitrospirota bacterium]